MAPARSTRFRPTRRCSSCATCWRDAGRWRGTGDEGAWARGVPPRRSCGIEGVRARRARFAGGAVMTATFSTLVVWHDVECGRYSADLPLWHELAARERGPILEVGA